MVIEKTTGRDCAWSIASKTSTKRLIAEGILGKAISRENFTDSYLLLRVTGYEEYARIIPEKHRGLAEEPLWTPAFIETGIWTQAVVKFQVHKELDWNVEKYLLPEMEEYLQNIPEAELIAMTREYLIQKGVLNTPISQRSGSTYYFNANEIYSVDRESKLFLYEKRIKFHMFKVDYDTCFNMVVWRKAASQFEVGMTLNDCISLFLKTELVYGDPKELAPIDRLVQYIAPPIYERIPENNDASTFDCIRMTVGLPRYHFNSWEDLRNEVAKYRHEIYQLVVQKLAEDRQFKRYGVPINFLKLSDVTLLRDYSVEFIFELKEQKADPPPHLED